MTRGTTPSRPKRTELERLDRLINPGTRTQHLLRDMQPLLDEHAETERPDDYRNSAVDDLVEIAQSALALAVLLEHMKPVLDVTIRQFGEAADEVEHALDKTTAWLSTVEAVVESLQTDLIRDGRQLRMPWARIGKALGMSGQGAYKKAAAAGLIENDPDVINEEAHGTPPRPTQAAVDRSILDGLLNYKGPNPPERRRGTS